MPDVETTDIGGLEYRGYRRGALSTDGTDQYVVPVRDRITSFAGRAASFRIPGNAGTSQTLATLHNASGSSTLVNINRITIDVTCTAVKAVTIQQPVIRLYRITVLPTAGTAMNKVGFDSTLTSSGSVTALQGASADRVASAITATIPSTTRIAHVQGPRVFTAVGYEMFDTYALLEGEFDVTLRALEGVAVVLEDAVNSTGNPATDWWTVEFDFEEYTRP